jgi:hypothetical protein
MCVFTRGRHPGPTRQHLTHTFGLPNEIVDRDANMTDTTAIDTAVRLHIYEAFLADGTPPSVAGTSGALGVTPDDAAAAYDRLAAGRVIVLEPGTRDVRMAAPLSAVPTRFRVRVHNGRSYYANCVWDALGVLAMLDHDGQVDASCADCDAPVELRVTDGTLAPSDAVVHFAVPAARWWEDIVFT